MEMLNWRTMPDTSYARSDGAPSDIDSGFVSYRQGAGSDSISADLHSEKIIQQPWDLKLPRD